MRRPGLWVANGHPGNTVTAMLAWRPGAITAYYDYLGPNKVFDYKAANPDAPIIVRFQHPPNWQQNPDFFARQLGELVASKWSDMRALDPYVYFANEMNLYYENGDSNPNNQPRYTTPEFYQRYAQWVRRTAEVIKNIVPEMKLVTPPFAYGHSEDGSPDDNGRPTEGWAGYDYLVETIRDYFDNILTFHSYWGHSGGSQKDWLYDPQLSTWYAFRWQRLLKLFETRYNIQARLIIDEAGNFATSDVDFTDQVMYHAEKCLNDGRVIAVTYFLWLDPTNSPGNLPNSWVQGIQNVQTHLTRLKNMPDVPILGPDVRPPYQETTIRVLFKDGTVQTMPLEEYLRAVVPAEMPALWPTEAVKAQAVAARSYAQHAIEHPRHNNADICISAGHCQNYNPDRVHAKSDEAIRLTKGLVARYNGQTINGVFSANCGGHTRNNEDIFGGGPRPYMRGVPCPNPGPKNGHAVGLCQYGARDLARQGHTYEEIIKYYYTGVTLGSPTSERTSNLLIILVDHIGQRAAEVEVRLIGAGQSVIARSKADGTVRFTNVPTATYTLEAIGFGLTEQVSPTAGQDMIVTLKLPQPQPTVRVELERLPGLPLIIGDWGEAQVRILIHTPAGLLYQTTTGTKPEFGVGGFEIYAVERGTYTLEIESYNFDVPMNGQTVRLNFRWQYAGVIEGILRNHQNQTIGGRGIDLTGPTNLSIVTDENGYFLFENLSVGQYSVTVEDSQIRQAATITGRNRVALALKFAAPPGTEEWQIKLERGQGLPLIVGDIGLPYRPIRFTSPSGHQVQVISGSKLEFGMGGFEIYATELGNYVIEFEGQRFVIPMNGQFTRVTFTKVSGAVDEQVRLISDTLPRSQAEALLKALIQANPDTQGLFEIVEDE